MILKNAAPAIRETFKAKSPRLLAVAAVFLLGGGMLVYWAWSRRSLTAKHVPVGSEVIPANAVMAIALSTDESQWQRLRQFGAADTQQQFDQTLARWRDRILADHNLSFGADMQSWVGPEVTLAVLPSPNAVETQPQPLPLPEDDMNLLAVLPIADPVAAKATLENRLGDQPETVETYKGVAIQTLDENLYGALLGTDAILLANRLPSIKQAIDAAKGGQSLGDVPGFSQAFEPLNDLRSLARIYVDVPSAALALAENSQPPLPTNSDYFQQPRGLAAAVVVEPQGLRLQAVSWFDNSTANTFTGDNSPSILPERLPADTLLAVTGGNFQQFWQNFAAGEQLSAVLPVKAENLTAALQSGTGLSLEDDLLPWMAGEFALGVLSPPSAKNSGDAPEIPAVPNPALVLMVQASDRSAAEQTLQQLDEVMSTRYGYKIENQTLGETFVTTRWTSADGTSTLDYGWLPDDVLVFTVGEGVMAELGPNLRRSLAASNHFQLTTGQAPRPNNGHFFIDVDAMAKAQDSLLLPPLPNEGLISSKAIDALGVTATILGERQVRYDLFLALPKGNRPGNLPPAGSSSAPEEPTSPPPEVNPEATPPAE
jgi:hypothetical protein